MALPGQPLNLRYKQMLEGMQAAKKRRSGKRSEKWFLYILKCADDSLYTGVTKDLERRFKMHSEGKAARYTRTRRPLEMVYRETCLTRTDALVRECAVKALSKTKKLTLIGTVPVGRSRVGKDNRIFFRGRFRLKPAQ